MARVSPGYTAFTKGEISPQMYGRADLDSYSACLEKCRNCVVRPFGGVSRISGTEYVANTRNNAYAKLIKFCAGENDNYMIEVTAGKFRFFKDGAALLDGNDNVYEVANDYTNDRLSSIQYVQIDDVIKLVCRDDAGKTNKPKELIRFGAANWVFRDVDFVCSPFLDWGDKAVSINCSATNGTITMTATADIFGTGHVGSYWRLGGTTTIDNVVRQGFVKITAFVNERQVTAQVLWTLTLDGNNNTNVWAEGAWSGVRGYPSTIALFDGRLYYGGTPYQPRNVFGSQPYAYEDYTPAVNNESSGAINVELASNASGDSSRLQWLVGASYLVAGTGGAEFVIKANSEASITPSDVTAKARTNWGSENIQPAVLGSMIHFVQAKGGKVRNFYYDYYTDMYKAVDVALFSEHLLETGIKDVAVQKQPDNVLWCLRSDGKLAGMVYEPDQEVQAWFLIEYDGAVIESIECIPGENGMYDEMYMVVKHTINEEEVRHIERSEAYVTPDVQTECRYLRDSLSYEGDISVTAVAGLDHLEGQTVSVFADGAVQSPKVVTDGSIILDTAAFRVTVGLPYVSYITTMPFEVGSENGTAIGKKKRVNELALRVWKTSAVRVGRDLSDLHTVQYRNPQTPMGTAEPLFTGIIPNIKYNQGWTEEASVTVEQSKPLPMNILAIVPIVNEVDK